MAKEDLAKTDEICLVTAKDHPLKRAADEE
jgi:hypothetical protein